MNERVSDRKLEINNEEKSETFNKFNKLKLFMIGFQSTFYRKW
jgi:hypothetical protein